MAKLLGIALLSGVTLLTTAAFAGDPPRDVSGKHHPNLARAQKAIDNAYNSLDAAQKANEFDMDGHAAKAKDLLQQADAEIKQAAEAANANHK